MSTKTTKSTLELIKRKYGIELKVGMYCECHGTKDAGFLKKAANGYIYLDIGKGQSLGPFHPTWEMVYYNNTIEKKIIYDFRKKEIHK